MKNREYTIINVYTQANGEKIAVSMLHKTKKGYYEEIKPTAAVEKYGKIEGEINSYWGKLPVVLVPVEQFAALKKEYDVIEYRGPVDRTRIKESKPRPDAMALKLYKAFAADAAAPRRLDTDGYPVEITVDGYRFQSGNGENLLKALKREYNFTKSDIAAAYALTLDNAADDAAEQPAAPVVDVPAADEPDPDAIGEIVTIPANQKNAAAPLIQAAKETGHLIICSVPKAEQPAAPVVEDIAAAVDAHFADMVANAPAAVYTEARAAGIITENEMKNAIYAPAADEQPTAAPSIKNADTPSRQKTAADDFIETGAYPIWYNTELECTSGNGVDFKVVSWGRKQVKVEYYDGQRRIYKVREFIDSVECGNIIVSAPYDTEYMVMLKRKQQPTEQQPAADPAPALTDADVLAAAARIKSNYEAIKQQAAADAYADAITAYCAALEEPAVPAWAPEVITLTPCPAWDDTPAADEQPAPAPRARRRLNIAPRLSRWLHPARWVAVTFVVCLMSGLLLGMNTSTAADAPAAADDIAAVYELAPVTITAAAVTDAPAADAVTPSNEKTASDIAAVTDAPAAADAVTPSSEKTVSDIAAVTDAPAAADAHGLTICAGTAWAYTMMIWA